MKITIEVPNNPTKGDILKAVFPNDSFFEDIFLEVMHYSNYKQIVSNWYNSSYKEDLK